jgi:hypothetical protein
MSKHQKIKIGHIFVRLNCGPKYEAFIFLGKVMSAESRVALLALVP